VSAVPANASSAANAANAANAIPRSRFDFAPLLLVLVLALIAWPFVGSTST